METATKVCSACKEEKPVTAFSKDASKSDGLYTRCKECKKQGTKKSEAVRERAAQQEAALVLSDEERQTVEAAANRAALKELIGNHQSEFIGLVQAHRRRLGVQAMKPRWIQIAEANSTVFGDYRESS